MKGNQWSTDVAVMTGWQLTRGLPGRQGSADRKRHCPIVFKDETGSDRETGRAPALHTGNWPSAWEMAQRESKFFIPNSLSLPLPLLFLPSSPFREVLVTTAAAPHPVSIHTQPSKPIKGPF